MRIDKVIKAAVRTGVFFILFLPCNGAGFLKGSLHKFQPEPYKDASVIHLSSGRSFDAKYLKDPASKGNYYILQLKGPIYEKDREEIELTGAEIVDYLPNYAYIIRVNNPEPLASLSALGGWVDPIKPDYKFSPLLSKSGMDTVIVLLFPKEDIETAASRIKEIGGKVKDISISDWNKKLKVLIDLSSVWDLARLKEVYWIEPCRTPRIINAEAQWVIQNFYPDLRKVWDRGIRGEGEVISTLDSGILTDHDMFRDPSVPITDFGDYPSHRKIIAYQATTKRVTFGDEKYPYHGTHTAGTACGDDEYVGGISPNDGMAPECKIYFLDGGTGEGWISVGRDLNVTFGMPYESGARVISNSYALQDSFPPVYSQYAREIDQFMWDRSDCLLLFGAGNNPPYPFVSEQAASKNSIAVGAVGNGIKARKHQEFSATGPTADGRYKPTLMAPGVLVSAYGGKDDSCIEYSGTSMATPCAAGAAILVREYFIKGFYPTGEKRATNSFNPSAALLKAMLINSCDGDIQDHYIPDNYIGWGRIDLDKVLYFAGDERRLLLADTARLSTGEYHEYSFRIEKSDLPLRVTLTWTDYPVSPQSGKALVNDLNLGVIGPDNKTYKGNVFSNGESATGGDYDGLNVEESVVRRNPIQGEWKIRVYGENVPYSPQPYSLVITGGVKSLAAEREKKPLSSYRFSVKTPAFLPEIVYRLSERAEVNISVYNSMGRKVAQLVDKVEEPGTYSIVWDSKDVPAGVYFYRFILLDSRHTAEKFSQTVKGILLKR